MNKRILGALLSGLTACATARPTSPVTYKMDDAGRLVADPEAGKIMKRDFPGLRIWAIPENQSFYRGCVMQLYQPEGGEVSSVYVFCPASDKVFHVDSIDPDLRAYLDGIPYKYVIQGLVKK